MTPDTASSQTLIILNPVSGQGDPTERRREVKRIAISYGLQDSVIETTPKKSAMEIAENALRGGVKQIIVGGGDGTIMEVLQAAVQKDVVIGVLPLGTGNLFAKNLSLPLTIHEAFTVALHGNIQRIDVAKANETYFSIIAGVGLDAEVMQHTKRSMKDTFGMWAYVVTGVRGLFRKSQKYNLIIDHKMKKSVRARSIMVANMARITARVQAVPKAHPQNGTLRIGIIQARRVSAWFSILYHTVKGTTQNSPHYDLLKGNHVEITPLQGKMHYQCDGNAFPPTKKLVITVFPGAVRVRTPINL